MRHIATNRPTRLMLVCSVATGLIVLLAGASSAESSLTQTQNSSSASVATGERHVDPSLQPKEDPESKYAAFQAAVIQLDIVGFYKRADGAFVLRVPLGFANTKLAPLVSGSLLGSDATPVVESLSSQFSIASRDEVMQKIAAWVEGRLTTSPSYVYVFGYKPEDDIITIATNAPASIRDSLVAMWGGRVSVTVSNGALPS